MYRDDNHITLIKLIILSLVCFFNSIIFFFTKLSCDFFYIIITTFNKNILQSLGITLKKKCINFQHLHQMYFIIEFRSKCFYGCNRIYK